MAPNKALLATFIYSDIFNFPLTLEEIYKNFLFTSSTKKEIQKMLVQMKNIIYKKNEYYFLKGREENVVQREERNKYTKAKIELAYTIVKILAVLPTIQLIGLSGSVAAQNAKKTDDVDLFIITKKQTVWITRFCVLCILFMLGKRRRRLQRNVTNVICTNMFIDETSLGFAKEKQNIYIAHEIVQMKPLFVRNNMDTVFLAHNKWIKKYLPNIKISSEKMLLLTKNSIIHTVLELITKKIQLIYMKKHITSETVTDTMLFFHPDNKEKTIIATFQERCVRYGI